MATLTYVTGRDAATNYVRVGHNSSATNADAVWSFALSQTGASKITSVTFTLKWNNSSAGTGWSGNFTYVFAVSTSGSSGTTAASGSVLGRKTVALSGSSGTATVTISGLSLSPGTKYYLRANFNGSTKSTMKAFQKASNTCAVANYTKLTYSITYNANGGSGAPSSQTKTYGVALTLRSTSGLSRTGYTCIGWAISKTATSAQYSSGGSYTENVSTTLYAVWKANTLTVQYYGNGATGLGSNSGNTSTNKATLHSTITYGNNSNINLYNVASLFSKTGYLRDSAASAWRVGSATSTTYWSEESINIPSSYFSSATNTVNLYANWKPNIYTVQFDPNGGSVSTVTKYVTYGSAYGSLPVPTRAGYKFLGWYTSSEGGTLITENSTVTINASQKLYAQWEAMGIVHVYIQGTQKLALAHVYQNGEYRQVIPYIYSNGSWKISI